MEKNTNESKYECVLGIVKEIDRVGRIVIPKEFRERLKLESDVEMVMTAEGVLIRNPKYEIVKKAD